MLNCIVSHFGRIYRKTRRNCQKGQNFLYELNKEMRVVLLLSVCGQQRVAVCVTEFTYKMTFLSFRGLNYPQLFSALNLSSPNTILIIFNLKLSFLNLKLKSFRCFLEIGL